jgi:hypothetical protein
MCVCRYDALLCMVYFKDEGIAFLCHGIFCFCVFAYGTISGYLHYYGACLLAVAH